MRRVHLDTDFAGDPDDACALALLLASPDVDLVGVTTVADPDGRRAGYVRAFLELAGRGDVPVARGAAWSRTHGGPMGEIPDHGRYWGSLARATGTLPEASSLLSYAIETGAHIVSIGPLTNLGALVDDAPGILDTASVTAMAGWFDPVAKGLPQWGPSADWNTQCDTTSAGDLVGSRADLRLVPLSTTVRVAVRRRQLARLEAAGIVGRLLARQALAYFEDQGKQAIADAHPGLPDDLLNFHHDPLTAAVAAAWTCVTAHELQIRADIVDDVLSYHPVAVGRPVQVITDVGSDVFEEQWLAAVERLP